MPAALDSSIVPGLSDIALRSHIPNDYASGFVRTLWNDFNLTFSHNRNMTRRGVPEEVNWFLKEWMDADPRFRGRGGQARMMEATGWSRATMSQLYNGKQDYSPNVVNQAAKALGVGPWELLMHPETAIALRPFVRALQPPPAPPPESPPAADHKPERRRAGGKKH